MSLFRSVWQSISNRQDCLLCVGPARSPVCDACADALPAVAGDACPQCAIPGAPGQICGACLASPPPFDAAHAGFRYQFPVDRLLQRFKYGAQLGYATYFAAALAEQLRPVAMAAPPDLLVPVPLSRERLAERGFNQSALLAAGLAAHLHLCTGNQVLHRTRHGQPQAQLAWGSRQDNVKGAFACQREVTGRHVAIVDDVMTTGATVEEAARVLKRHGAARVSVWVVARAERRMTPAAGDDRPHV